jgi:hypothetical protein
MVLMLLLRVVLVVVCDSRVQLLAWPLLAVQQQVQ